MNKSIFFLLSFIIVSYKSFSLESGVNWEGDGEKRLTEHIYDLDSIKFYNSYRDGRKLAKKENKNVLLIFASSASINCLFLKEYIINKKNKEYFENYVIVWLDVGLKEGEELKNLTFQKRKFKSNEQPYIYMIKNKRVIREFLGFSRLEEKEYLKFLTEK